MPVRMVLFPNLKEHRESRMLKQSGLASRTKKIDPEGKGVSTEKISQVENGGEISRRLALILVRTLSDTGELLDPRKELKIRLRTSQNTGAE